MCMVGHGERSRPVESVKILECGMDFCYLLQETKRRFEPGDQAWATTPVMVDAAAQNLLCAAISTTSDENACLTAVCAAFVKRMAYAKAVLKVDPEPASRSLAEKIAVRASADGIQLKVEVAPRFSSRSICEVSSKRCSGRSDSMLASRVGNASLVGSDSSSGCVAVDGGTLEGYLKGTT